MMPYDIRVRRAAAILWLVVLGLSIYVIYATFTAFSLRKNTVAVDISADNKSALLSISQDQSQAAVIGKGHVVARLKPGRYYVAASLDSTNTGQFLSVKLGESAKLKLSLASPVSVLPSVEDIDFTGTNLLLDSGLATSQVANLKELFFTYNNSIKTVEITSFVQDPRDAEGTSAWVSGSIAGFIDKTGYYGNIKYSGFDAISVTLFDSKTKQQIYSGTLPAIEADE